MTFRWSEEDIAAFNKRREKWDEEGTVRTHICADASQLAVSARGQPTRKNGRSKDPVQKLPRTSERKILKACVDVLNVHPKVAIAWRQNTGLAFGRGQPVRFSFKGCSDILGMLVGGRFFACEVKATGKTASPDQEAFLKAVNDAGGLGVCVDDPKKLVDALEGA